MVQKPHLQPVRLTPADKRRARSLQGAFLRQLAAKNDLVVGDQAIDAMLADVELREALGLCTYAADLFERLEGRAVGPASLALWRSFAWTPQGSPRPDFELTVAAILTAEQRLGARLIRDAGA